MRVWHMAKTWEGFAGIVHTGLIRANGRNVAVRTEQRFAHVSLEPFSQCRGTFDMLNAHEIWLFEVDISDDAQLQPDPSEDDPDWVVSQHDLRIMRFAQVLYIEDTFEWIDGWCEAEPLPIKRFGASVGKVLSV